MKTIALIITSMVAATVAALAEGLPMDGKTRQILVPHTVVNLTPEQIEETQILSTLTLTPEQWRGLRKQFPNIPKRFDTVLPVTSRDCACGLEGSFVIQLSRNRAAFLNSMQAEGGVEWVRYELFRKRATVFQVNERGEFHIDGTVIPFSDLLKALESPPDYAKRNQFGRLITTETSNGETFETPYFLIVNLPVDAKPDGAVYAARLSQIRAACERIGLQHYLPDASMN
jgi:hypothetical protein